MAKLKILLIDDEKDFLELMGRVIKMWGYDLITALNGKDGIDAVKKKSPDIIILDYIMPDLDGLSTLKKIRRIDRKIPVIMFTAHPDGKSLGHTERLGVSSYIPKMSAYSDTHATLKAAIEMATKKLGDRGLRDG
ncbi:MAG: response regulator [Candidatus Omnitrophica bacterium]|nr:response regulator [Candidatus Omnitrophota bacterium]